MINEYLFYNQNELLKRVYCSTQKQAYEKLKFLYPNSYFLVEIKRGRSFKDFDDFIENRKSV